MLMYSTIKITMLFGMAFGTTLACDNVACIYHEVKGFLDKHDLDPGNDVDSPQIAMAAMMAGVESSGMTDLWTESFLKAVPILKAKMNELKRKDEERVKQLEFILQAVDVHKLRETLQHFIQDLLLQYPGYTFVVKTHNRRMEYKDHYGMGLKAAEYGRTLKDEYNEFPCDRIGTEWISDIMPNLTVSTNSHLAKLLSEHEIGKGYFSLSFKILQYLALERDSQEVSDAHIDTIAEGQSPTDRPTRSQRWPEPDSRIENFHGVMFLTVSKGPHCPINIIEPHMIDLLKLLMFVQDMGDEELKGYLPVDIPSMEKEKDKTQNRIQEIDKVFEAYRQVKGGAPVIHEEALRAVSALANAVESGFEPFMPHFVPFLHMSLQGIEDTSVCEVAVGVVTDLCWALQIKVLPYVEQFVTILYTNLQNPKVDRKIKAAIMTTFGDIALAITGEFEKFLGPVIGMLSEASLAKVEDGDRDNEDWVDYLNQLRENVLVAYAEIIYGLRESGKISLFKEHVNSVLDFIRRIVDDSTVSEDVIKQAVCVVGDMIMVFPQELTAYLSQAPFLPKLVKLSSESQDQEVRKTSQWLLNLLQCAASC